MQNPEPPRAWRVCFTQRDLPHRHRWFHLARTCRRIEHAGGLQAGVFPRETGDVILPAAEELRLAYVTVTRAQQRVELGSLGWITEPLPTPSDDLPGFADRREQSPSAVAEPRR